MLDSLIQGWNQEHAVLLGRSGNNDVLGFNRLVSESLRAQDHRLNGLLSTIGLARRIPSLVSKLVNDIEDAVLPLTIETTHSPLDHHAAVCWIIDTWESEFWVPDSYRLSPDQALWVEQRTDYVIDESGTFAHYRGPDRYAAATLTPHSLMRWASHLLAHQHKLLAETLECSRTSVMFQDALNLVTRCAHKGHAATQAARLHASRPFMEVFSAPAQ